MRILVHVKVRNENDDWEEKLFKIPNEVYYDEFIENCKLFWDEVEVLKKKEVV